MRERYICHTAEDEEPNCNHCANCCEDPEYCENNCGPEYGWKGYQRMEVLKHG